MQSKRRFVPSSSAAVRVYQKLKFGHVLNDIYDLDGIAKFLKLPAWDEIEEQNDYFASEGDDIEDEAERDKAVEELATSTYLLWKKNILQIFEHLLGSHSMYLRQFKNGDEFQVAARSWRKAAEDLICTINGYGTFGFDTPEELRDAIPVDTIREAVLRHLHWIRMYPKVYGTASIEQMWDRLCR